ncbi:ornithine decarboxylase-like [Hyperolius riggenbachi]|uniref:ornithine decarboxylase-like n=1 Tax=Hyperolius riggenbachi TaxID=752182 RepID=UPI0035A3A408
MAQQGKFSAFAAYIKHANMERSYSQVKKKKVLNASSWSRMRDSSPTLVEEGTTALHFLEERIKSSLNADKDAFFVADLDDVVHKHWQFVEGLPRVRPFYAVKCNNSPEILRTLAILGTGFDCASQAEINMILGMGIPADDIVYANPCKQPSHIQHAAAHGVNKMTFDCESELEKVATFHTNAEMILRIFTDDDDDGSVSNLSKKFGAPLESWKHLLKTAMNLNISVTGVSFHVGTGSGTPQSFHKAIKNARYLFDLGKELGHKMKILDIGGGFPGHPDFQPPFEEFAAVIMESLEEYFPSEEEVEIIAEPGRYYVTSAFTAALNVTTKKEKRVRDPDGVNRRKFLYYMNDGVFGSFLHGEICKKEMSLKPFVGKDWLPSAECFPSTLWGPSCTDKDLIMENVYLPELEVGDWIFFPNMGAYYVSVYTVFNGFLPPPVFCFISKSLWSSMEEQWHKLSNNTP